MAQAQRKPRESPAPRKTPRARPMATGVAVDQDEKKRRTSGKDVLAKAPEKPGAGRSTQLGRKVESPASLKTAGPSGQRTKTAEQKRHTNK